jgi:hypothetical protein
MHISRTRVIELWIIGVVLAALVAFVFGSGATGTTIALLVALALVPPALILMLWPGARTVTARDVLYGRS